MSDEREDYLNLTGPGGGGDTAVPPPPPEHRPSQAGDGRRWRGPLVGAGVCAVAIVAIAGIRFASGQHQDHSAPAVAATSSTSRQAPTLTAPSSSTSTSATTASSSPAATATGPAATTQNLARQTAEKFVRELVNTRRSQQQWQKATSALGTSAMAHDLAVTDKGDIPLQIVDGPVRVVNAATDEPAVTVFVSTSLDGYTLVLLSNDGGRTWLVDGATPGKSSPTDAE